MLDSSSVWALFRVFIQHALQCRFCHLENNKEKRLLYALIFLVQDLLPWFSTILAHMKRAHGHAHLLIFFPAFCGRKALLQWNMASPTLPSLCVPWQDNKYQALWVYLIHLCPIKYFMMNAMNEETFVCLCLLLVGFVENDLFFLCQNVYAFFKMLEAAAFSDKENCWKHHWNVEIRCSSVGKNRSW